MKLFWAAEHGPDIQQTITIFSEVRVALTTESEVAEKEKNKRVKVYGRLIPPPGAVSVVKQGKSPLSKPAAKVEVKPVDEVKKTLFASSSNGENVNTTSTSDDDVIVEEEEIITE